jgi:hypothetical protein
MNRKPFLVALAELLSAYWPRVNTPQWLRAWLPTRGNVVFTLLAMALLLWAQSAGAFPSQATTAAPGPSATTVNYQGRLANSGGTPITQNGVSMQFAIYDAPTGGNLVWGSESHTVNVANGLFNVGLGSVTSGGIPTTVWNGDRYLQITVGGETLSPRELIRSVPIAGMALTVPDGAITTAKIADGAVTTAKFAPGALKIPVYSSSTTTTEWQVTACNAQLYSIPGLNVNLTVDVASVLEIDASGLATNLAANAAMHTIPLVDGNAITTASGALAWSGYRNYTPSGLWYGPYAHHVTKDVAVGSHTVGLSAFCDGGTGKIHSGWLVVKAYPK